jgi:hypothetical protein
MTPARNLLRTVHRAVPSSILCAVLLAGVLGAALPAGARAQAAADQIGDPITADWKGTIGCGLLGAELGFVIPAVAGMNETWAFIVFPVVGAAGGAVGGYFGLEQGDHVELAVASLTLGMALVIPTLVFTLSQTAYDPTEDAAANGGNAPALARASRLDDPRYAGTGLVRVADEGVAVAAPGVTVSPSAASRHRAGGSDVQVSLLSGRF